MVNVKLAELVQSFVIRLDGRMVRLEGKRHRGRGSLLRSYRAEDGRDGNAGNSRSLDLVIFRGERSRFARDDRVGWGGAPKQTQGPLRLRSGQALDFARDDRVGWGAKTNARSLDFARDDRVGWDDRAGVVFECFWVVFCFALTTTLSSRAEWTVRGADGLRSRETLCWRGEPVGGQVAPLGVHGFD